MGTTRRRAAAWAVVVTCAPVLPAALPAAAYAQAAPATRVEVSVHRTTGRAGKPTAVVGHLFSAADDPVPGQVVQLYAAPFGGSPVPAGQATTDAHGAAAFQVTPQVSTTYTVRHGEAADAVDYPVTPSPTAPGEPERLVAEPGNGSARVYWFAPEDDGGSPVTAYEVTVERHSPFERRTVRVPAATRSRVVTGLANGIYHSVQVTAHTAQGSATATVHNLLPRADAPPLPAGGTAVCGRLPFGVTRWTALDSPYHVCPAGVIVPTGATLEVDAAEVRFAGVTEPQYWSPYGLDVRGGGLRATGSALRGETGRRGEWSGIVLDRLGEDHNPNGRTGSTVSLAGTTVRHAVDAVRTTYRASLLRLDDTTLAEASGAGLKTRTPPRASGLTVRDVGGAGVDVTCRRPDWPRVVPCVTAIAGVTVERAAGRGLSVDTDGTATVTNAVVTASGTKAPVSEAARFSGMSARVGPGGDIEDVRGGGNGIDAVVLDLTATHDLTWRNPAAGSASAPAPLGYLVRNLRVGSGATLTFPAGSVVKGVPVPSDCRVTRYDGTPCAGGVEALGGRLDASAPGSLFTGAADGSAGIRTCPSALAPACGGSTPWWGGLAVHGGGASATIHGATVRGAGGGLVVDTGPGPGGVPAATATVTATTFDRAAQAVATTAAPISLTDVQVLDSPRGVVLGSGRAELTRVTVRRSGGVRSESGTTLCPPEAGLSVTDLLVEDAPGPGLEVRGACHPAIHGVTVRRSGLPGPADDLGSPAVVLSGSIVTLGPGNDVSGVTGGGNGIDAIALSGRVPADLTWVSPYNAAADHPLGYVVGAHPADGGLAVEGPDATLTLPANALVASLHGRGLLLRRASLDATAGGARLVSAYDPLASALGCRRSCGTRAWDGVQVAGDWTGDPGTTAVTGATVRGGDLTIGSLYSGSTVVIDDSDLDGAVRATSPTALTVTDSSFRRLVVSYGSQVDVSRNTVPFAGGGIDVNTSSEEFAPPVVLRDNAVAAGRDRPAFTLSNANATFGQDGTVQGNTGSGANAVLALSGVTAKGGLAWVDPVADPRPHPVGYAVVKTEQGPWADRLTVDGPGALTVPAGGVVKAPWLRLTGGAGLDASAGGATFTHPGDDTVGVSTCGWYLGPGLCAAGPVPVTIESVYATARPAGPVAIARARVNGSIDVRGAAGEAPGASGFAVAVTSSYVRGSLTSSGAATTVTGTRFDGGAVHLRATPGSVLRDVVVDGATRAGLRIDDSPDASVREVVVTRSATAPEFDDRGAVQLTGTTAGTFACLDVRDNANGLAALGAAVTVTDSSLAGNAAYDLDNTVAVTTSGVWWGQEGGPAPGQVRDPALHADSAPRSAPPACATAETAAPPAAPGGVTAAPGARSLDVAWSAPAHDGGTPVVGYRVTLTPGGTVTVGASARRHPFSGLTPGATYYATVTAVNATGAGAASRPAAGVPAADSTVLSVVAPGSVTYGTAATVAGRLTTRDGAVLPGRAVRLHVRAAGTSAWGAPRATATTGADGRVAFRVALSATSDVHLAYAGDAGTLATASRVLRVAVRPVITAALARSSVPYGTATTLSGRVSPHFAGHAVRLERWTRDGWVPLTGTTVSSASTYRFTVKPGVRGTFHYRVVYPGGPRYARAVSPTRSLTVA